MARLDDRRQQVIHQLKNPSSPVNEHQATNGACAIPPQNSSKIRGRTSFSCATPTQWPKPLTIGFTLLMKKKNTYLVINRPNSSPSKDLHRETPLGVSNPSGGLHLETPLGVSSCSGGLHRETPRKLPTSPRVSIEKLLRESPAPSSPPSRNSAESRQSLWWSPSRISFGSHPSFWESLLKNSIRSCQFLQGSLLRNLFRESLALPGIFDH